MSGSSGFDPAPDHRHEFSQCNKPVIDIDGGFLFLRPQTPAAETGTAFHLSLENDMTTNCCGNAVPPVPEKPIDLNQPAYVLVDGQWVLLADVIGAYLPPAPPAETGAVLSVKHIVVPFGSVEDRKLVSGGNKQISPLVEITPTSPNSRLVAMGVTGIQRFISTGTAYTGMTVGFRNQLTAGVWPSNSAWTWEGANEASTFSGTTQSSFAFQIDLDATDYRSDGKWAVAAWALCGDVNVAVHLNADVKLTFIEYLAS